MINESPAVAPVARINPFAFPSDTDSRFALLVVSVVGVSILLYSLMFEAIPVTSDLRRAQYEECFAVANPYVAAPLADRMTRTATNSECTATVDRIQALTMLGGVTLLMVVAAAIYWTAPRRRIRSRRLNVLEAEDAADVLTSLAELCTTAGITPMPRFVWDPLDTRVSGSAFGRLRRYYIALSGGLVTEYYADRAAFNAVILHELAHLRNADVDKTYIAIAVWQSFLATALLPLAVSLALSGHAPREILAVSWRVIPLVLLVYVMRNAVLRAREVYADVRASVWDGPAGALRRTIQNLGSPNRPVWRRMLTVHPDPAVRRQMLDDTSLLFQLRLWDAFAAGVAAGIVYLDVEALLELLVPWPWSFLRVLGAALLIAPLLIGVAGLDIWRATLAALTRGEGVRNIDQLAVMVATGFVLGLSCSFGAAFLPAYAGGDQVALAGIPLVLLTVAWGVLLLAVLLVLVRWIGASASTWLELAATQRSPRAAWRIGLTVASVVLAVWLAGLFTVYLVFRWAPVLITSPELWSEFFDGLDTYGPGEAGLLTAVPYYWTLILFSAATALTPVVTLAVMVAFALAPWVWRARTTAGSVSAWVFDAVSSPPLTLPRQPSLRPDLALGIGLLGGVSFILLSVLTRTTLLSPGWVRIVASFQDSTLSEQELRAQTSTLVALIWTASEVGLLAVLQASVAAAVVTRVKRLVSLHALFATLVASCLSLVGWLVIVTSSPGGEMSTTDWILALSWGSCAATGLAVAGCVTASGALGMWGWIAGAWRRIHVSSTSGDAMVISAPK